MVRRVERASSQAGQEVRSRAADPVVTVSEEQENAVEGYALAEIHQRHLNAEAHVRPSLGFELPAELHTATSEEPERQRRGAPDERGAIGKSLPEHLDGANVPDGAESLCG